MGFEAERMIHLNKPLVRSSTVGELKTEGNKAMWMGHRLLTGKDIVSFLGKVRCINGVCLVKGLNVNRVLQRIIGRAD